MDYIENRFNYNDFRPFFVKNGKFDDQTIRKKIEKNHFLRIDFITVSYTHLTLPTILRV